MKIDISMDLLNLAVIEHLQFFDILNPFLAIGVLFVSRNGLEKV